jgi:hypothetical protein
MLAPPVVIVRVVALRPTLIQPPRKTPMITLADLQVLAIEIRGATHACYSIRDRDKRRAALDAVAARYKGRMPVNGVSVSAIVPETRTGRRHTVSSIGLTASAAPSRVPGQPWSR